MKKLLLIILSGVLLPAAVLAEGFPNFPMSFWGKVTINSQSAPVGTIIRAYSNGSLVGQVTVNENGIYGYTEPTKQKLVVGNATGTISFTFQCSYINDGVESSGNTVQSFSPFSSGETKNLDLAFEYNIPLPTPSGGGVSVGVGGGGGGSMPSMPYNPSPTLTVTSTTTSSPKLSASTIISNGSTSTTLKMVLGVKISRIDELIGKLKPGKNSKEVIELQNELKKLGYFSANFKPTTFYGNITTAAVQKYLTTKKGLVKPDSKSIEQTSLNDLIASVKFGQRNEKVKKLQTELKKAGHYPKNLIITGYYGNATKKAVEKYLSSKGN